MIYQVTSVKTKTEPLPKINRGLIQARFLQARLKEAATDAVYLDDRLLWSPITPGPFAVPATRWVE